MFLVEVLRSVARTVWMAVLVVLLPSPERERAAYRGGLDAPRCSFLFGLVQGAVGVGLFLAGGLAFMRGSALDLSFGLLQNWVPGLSTTHFRGAGVLSWLAWFVYPASWPPAYLALVGLGRAIAFGATREAVGEPVVVAALRLWQAARRRSARRRDEHDLGPLRPDRMIEEPGGLAVLSCREKPDWSEIATVEIDGRFYRIAGRERVADGEHRALAYHLREVDEGALIRRLVRYPGPGKDA
jgi:hypothetical protein